MLCTYDRLMQRGFATHDARVTRHRDTTYDHRDPYDLIRQLQAEVDALRRYVQQQRHAMKQTARGME